MCLTVLIFFSYSTYEVNKNTVKALISFASKIFFYILDNFKDTLKT